MSTHSRVPPSAPGRPQAVFARHAASLLVVREGAHGPEVLMGVRGAGHRFVPNRLVFPGGAVDPADRTAPAATEPGAALLSTLQLHARRPLARGIAMAAARELHEETGVWLAASPGEPLLLDRLSYLCRAVTPPRLPMRFNARFLVASAEAVCGLHEDSRELNQVRFYPVADAIALDLMAVTRWVLECLLRRLAGTEVSTPMVFRNERPVIDARVRSAGRPSDDVNQTLLSSRPEGCP